MEAAREYSVVSGDKPKLEISLSLPEGTKQQIAAFWERVSGPIGAAGDGLKMRLWLYQLDTAMKILDRAADLARTHNIKVGPLPPKFLLPFLEKCGAEDSDQELYELWAKLFLNAAAAFDATKFIFLNILSSISAAEARILLELVEKRPTIKLGNRWLHSASPMDHKLIEREFQLWMAAAPAHPWGREVNIDELAQEFLSKRLQAFPVCITYFSVALSNLPDSKLAELPGSRSLGGETSFAAKNARSLMVLEQLGLIRTVSAQGGSVGAFPVYMSWIELTALGVNFCNDCRSIPNDDGKKG